MTNYNQIRALLPDLINGKTHDELKEQIAANDKKMCVHHVDGVKMPFFIPRSNLEALKTFEVRKDDIFVVTFPRSGTHWTMEILQLILHDGKDGGWDRSILTHGLEISVALKPSQVASTEPGFKKCERMQSPRCLPTHALRSHLPPQVWTKQAKVIYVARNPKDILVSLHNFVCEKQNFEEFLWSFYTGEMIYGPWFEHVTGYWRHKDDANVFFLKYEDLHKDLKGFICKLATFVGKEISDDVIDRIKERVTLEGMRKTYRQLDEQHGEKARWITHGLGSNVPHVRKGRVGNWKNVFTVAQNELFDKIYALQMQTTDLEFDFEL